MSNSMSNLSNQKSSLCPANGRQAVGDGAFTCDTEPAVLAVCHMQGSDDKYYYSTTFSGGPEVSSIFTTTPYSSRGATQPFTFIPSGAFDTTKAKCPPDRGSLDCVTGSPASFSPSTKSFNISSRSPSHNSFTLSLSPACSLSSSVSSNSSAFSAGGPRTPPEGDYLTHRSATASSTPLAIPSKSCSTVQLCTPPLTPDDDADSDDELASTKPQDALEFLMSVFPHDGMKVLPHAKGVTITATTLGGSTFEGVIVDMPGCPRTLYVDGKSAQSVDLRESVVALLDLALEPFDCAALVIVLEKSSPSLSGLLHSLLYVGGSIVSKPVFQVDPALVLVGMDV